MPDNNDFDDTLTVLHGQADPDDCATMVTREVAPAEPSVALERRIKTIDRIIHSLKE